MTTNEKRQFAIGAAPCERCTGKEEFETADPPRAVAVMDGREGPVYLCGECAADWRAYAAQEEHAEAAATALEEAVVIVEKATAKSLEHSWECPDDGRRFDHGGDLSSIASGALATAALCGEAIRVLETARASCERGADQASIRMQQQALVEAERVQQERLDQ